MPAGLFLHFITTFHNFALKIEIIWAKMLVKPINSETRNVNDVNMHIWFNSFSDNKFKKDTM